MVLALKGHGEQLSSYTMRGVERPLVEEQLQQQWKLLGIKIPGIWVSAKDRGTCGV